MKTYILQSVRPVIIRLSVILLIAYSAVVTGCDEDNPAENNAEVPDDLMDPAIQPKILSTFPADGSTGPFNLYDPGDGSYEPNFIIQFNKLINVDQLWDHPSYIRIQGFHQPVWVLDASHLGYRIGRKSTSSPASPWTNILECVVFDSSSWRGRRPYDIGQTYTVVIDTALEDINGYRLAEGCTFSFTPEPYFRLLSFNPADGSQDIDRSVIPWLRFNSPLDAKIYDAVHMSAPIDGDWIIDDDESSLVYFRNVTEFEYGSDYVISVDAGARDAVGHPIHAPDSAAFRIISFKMKSSTPANGELITDLDQTVRVVFSGQIDTSTAGGTLSIDPSVEGSVSVSPSAISFHPTIGYIPETTYTVTVSGELRSLEGIRLDAPAVISFRTGRFRVTGMGLLDGSVSVPLNRITTVGFNGAIDTTSVPSSFHISPAVPVAFTMGRDYFNFAPAGFYAPLTKYVVTVDSTVRSIHGPSAGERYRTYFTTGE